MTLQCVNIIAVFLLCQQAFVESAVKECSGDVEYSIFGMMLRRHIFKKIMGAPLGGVCLRECYRDFRCQSFNYVLSKEMCELNNRTKEARPEDFVSNSDRYYFRRDMNRVRLGSIPDLPAESCQEIKASEGDYAVNGEYWLHFLEIGKIVLAYCDMKTEAFNAVFTNLGASGRYGPTTLGSHYTGQAHDSQVTLSSGIQQWTVPYTGDYRIEAVGAAGGYDTYTNSTQYRGRGARMIGTFSLLKGEIIQILVGQEGGINKVSYSSGGGGGSFVVRGSNTPLIIAGGGGGVDTPRSRHDGCDASTNTSGNPGYKSWPGGSNGHGAKTADRFSSGGGGGGFLSTGRSSTQFGGDMGNGGEGGRGFLQGGVGGRALYNSADGGFGGGGGAFGGGGGGGYSGGSSGKNRLDSCGGGGGSYNTGTNQRNECCSTAAGHGQITITLL